MPTGEAMTEIDEEIIDQYWRHKAKNTKSFVKIKEQFNKVVSDYRSMRHGPLAD